MQAKKTLGKWCSILAIPLFILGTAVFSFLWNVPLDKLCALRAADTPPAVLLRDTPSASPRTVDPSLLPGLLPMLNYYEAAINNCGRLDFTSYAPAEVEIRMDHLVIGMNADKMVFNFRTKYGFHLQTSRKPGPNDRVIYKWLKSLPCAGDGAGTENLR